MQTICVYVLIPAAVYAVIALLTLVPKLARTPRYRPGQPWSYDPVWWSAHGESMQSVQQRAAQHGAVEPAAAVPASSAPSASTARGGARGNW